MKNLVIISLSFICFNLYSQSNYDKAVMYHASGEYEKAIPLFQDYLETINDMEAIIDVEEYIADSYREINKLDIASKWAYKILEKDSLNELALFLILKISIDNGDSESIYKTTNSLIDNLGVKEVQTYYFRGLALINMGRADLALKDMQKAYELDSYQPGVVFYLGALYTNLNEYDKAIPLLTNSIDLNFEVDRSFYNLAVIYYSKEDYKTAHYFLNKTLETNPNYFQTSILQNDFNYMQGAIYFNLGDYRKALVYLEKINDIKFKDYQRATEITVYSYENLEKEYHKKKELEKAAYFAAKKAERIFNEGFIEDGLKNIDRAISLDSSIHYMLFKAYAMTMKILYYVNESIFEDALEILAYSREALELTKKVYGDIFEIDPKNEFYLNSYLCDLYFFDDIFDESEILEEICWVFDKLEEFDYDYDEQIRNTVCFDTNEKTEFDYNRIIIELEPFEERFGMSLIEDKE